MRTQRGGMERRSIETILTTLTAAGVRHRIAGARDARPAGPPDGGA
jgi:hypothetical protein